MPTIGSLLLNGPSMQEALAQPVEQGAKKKGIGVAPYASMVAGNAADLGSTIAALHSGMGREANPLLSHGGIPAIVAAKFGGTALTAYAMKKLAEGGHPKAAKTLGYAEGLALGILAAHNASVMKR